MCRSGQEEHEKRVLGITDLVLSLIFISHDLSHSLGHVVVHPADYYFYHNVFHIMAQRVINLVFNGYLCSAGLPSS
jgi:hypothetical protein